MDEKPERTFIGIPIEIPEMFGIKKPPLNAITVNLRISTRSAYFKFRRKWGRLFEGESLIEVGVYLIFLKWCFEMIIFFNTTSVRRQQNKLFIDIKS